MLKRPRIVAICASLASLPTSLGYSTSLLSPLVCGHFPMRHALPYSNLCRLPAPKGLRTDGGITLVERARTMLTKHSGVSGFASSSTCQLQVEQFPCLSDNYGYLVHDAASGKTAAIDTPDVEAYLEALDRRGWKLTHILNTHHHHDHAGGNLELKRLTGCQIVGPANEKDKIPGIDVPVAGGDTVVVGGLKAKVLDVGGHTKGHIAFHFDDVGMAFVGDSLFAMGCGRMFEGTYDQMFASIVRLAALPADTAVYCAHEYTLSNAKFAVSVEPSNLALQTRYEEVQRARQRGEPTVPTKMQVELLTNPFLRYQSPEIRKVLGVAGNAPDVDAFAAIRKAKDSF